MPVGATLPFASHLPVLPVCRRVQVLRASSGASAVELAVLLPFIMAILFAFIEFSFLLYDKAMITNAAREGARWGIVLTKGNATCPPTTRRSLSDVQTWAVQYCANKMISIVGGGACQATATQVLATPGCPKFGDKLSVKVTYTYNATALLALYKIMSGGQAISSSATMQYE